MHTLDHSRRTALLGLFFVFAACAKGQAPAEEKKPAAAEKTLSNADAKTFVARTETESKEFWDYARRTAWVRANFITDDTNWLAERMRAKATTLAVKYANEAKAFNDVPDLDADTARKLQFIKRDVGLPAPSRPGAAEELARITTKLGTLYSTGKVDLDGKSVALDELEVMMGEVHDPKRTKEIWTKWRRISVPMKNDYARMVDIANEGAKELGFKDVREMWLSGYDMEPDAVVKEADRLWSQVEPLYKDLHCYVRNKLNAKYGDKVVPKGKPIRADILGNMWAQQWGGIQSIVSTTKGSSLGYDLTTLLKDKGYTPRKMVETAEGFFMSLGIEKLPETFWKRSLIEKPRDRDVVCHASAWDLDNKDDIRIKMCTKVNADDFQTVHHELGHNIYQRAYKDLSPIYQTGAHDGFHEAIGDFIALSITPDYLRQIGLITAKQIPPPEADITLLLNLALDKIAFLPFGLMMDKWRWEVLAGETKPDQYNERWWQLRTQYQGIEPPDTRPKDAFDPGAKYHIAGNTPYLRYFLSFILQFQFHKAACSMADWKGPLHRCSIYGSKKVGKRFNDMMKLGASQPWPDTLEAFTGTRTMDGSAILEYFAPLRKFLQEENKGQTCGW